MKLQSMRYFVEIARYKSISEAARQLYISQSVLSTALQEIEKELGTVLFERGRKGVVLTRDGEDCLNYCLEIVERVDALTDRYHAGSAATKYFSVTSAHLPFAVRAFSSLVNTMDSNDYNMCMREAPLNNVFEDVISGRSEIGVVAVSEDQLKMITNRYKNAVSYTRIMDLTQYVFIHSKHPLAGETQIQVNDLKPYPYVTYDQGEVANTYTEEKLFHKMFKKSIQVSDRASKLAMIRNTNAFSIGVDLPNYSSDIFFKNTNVEIVGIPLQENTEEQVGYLTKPGYAISEIGERYIKQLTDELYTLKMNGTGA